MSFAEASYYGPTEDIKVVSKTGSKVTAPVIDFKGKTVNIQGNLGVKTAPISITMNYKSSKPR